MTTAADPRPALHVPAREIPVPTTISPEAQDLLAAGPVPRPPYPDVDDLDAWRAQIQVNDEGLLAMTQDKASRFEADVEELDVDGAHVYAIEPEGMRAGDRRVYIDLHGGSLIVGGGASCCCVGIATAALLRMRVWAVDYRMPPDHPYPTGLDDCLAAYRALLRDHAPGEIVIGGLSAGGNLAAALVLRARDEGLPLPAAAVLLTPELDLTESGDSFRTNWGVDSVLTTSLMPANLLYAGGHDLAHPYLSPLFSDLGKGFPPTLLATGTRDLFLSNTVRMHRALRAAGVPADLHVFEALPHGTFVRAEPEEADLGREIRAFIDAYTTR